MPSATRAKEWPEKPAKHLERARKKFETMLRRDERSPRCTSSSGLESLDMGGRRRFRFYAGEGREQGIGNRHPGGSLLSHVSNHPSDEDLSPGTPMKIETGVARVVGIDAL